MGMGHLVYRLNGFMRRLQILEASTKIDGEKKRQIGNVGNGECSIDTSAGTSFQTFVFSLCVAPVLL